MATTQKILIVDNERHIRTLLKQALRKLSEAGVTVLTAETGVEALKLIDQERPDLVFLDLMMPGLHGFDVCRLIKADWRIKNTYVAILTARGQFVDKQMGSMCGADEYITKPFDPEYIARRSFEVLKIDNLQLAL